MKPLREDSEAPRPLVQLLEAAREVPEATPAEQALVWRRITESADARRLKRTSPWVIATPAFAAFALTLLIAPHLIHRADPQAVALSQRHVVAVAGAKFELAAAVVALQSGSLEASPGARVHTPQLEIDVGSAHCRIQVAGEVTSIDVLDGELSVHRGDGPVLVLSGGTRFRSDDPRLIKAAPIAAPIPTAAPQAIPDACLNRSASERRSCYTGLALGSDLAAQNAAYMLGQLDRDAHDLPSAIASWTAYQRRFPDGALWPESAVGILTARLDQGAWTEALAAGEAYLARVPSGGRAPEVKLIRANLLREHLGRLRPALDAYRELANSDAPAAIRGEARFGEALASQRLGLRDDSRAALDSYARDFPEGPHAAEVARLRAQ